MYIKICGAISAEQIHQLESFGVDYVGLWSAIPNGAHNLSEAQAIALAQVCIGKTNAVLVTTTDDLKILEPLLAEGHFHAIQLHGFSLPARIAKIKSLSKSRLRIFKVLHFKDQACLEEDLIPRYLKSGVDIFILDSYQNNQAIGSTGLSISNATLDHFFKRYRIEDKCMIAGGIGRHNIASIFENYEVHGVDIDSAARRDGKLSSKRIKEIMQAKASPSSVCVVSN